MDTEFFPRRLRLERNMWTDNDRNLSHFIMKTFTDFARFGNPTPQQVLGLHFDVARNGELKYLNLNTTYNSSILLNYRQTESAFWTQVIFLSCNKHMVRSKVILFLVFTNGYWGFGANLSTINGILVGASRTIANSILEYGCNFNVSNGFGGDLLHSLEEC